MADQMTATEMEYCKRREEFFKKLLSWKDKLNKLKLIGKKLLSILFGGTEYLKAIASGILPEIVAASAAFATQIVNSYFSAASSAVRTALEAIFNQILKILLAGPESIFSLVNLPLKQARLHCKQEAVYLTQANGALNTIMRILNKWLSGFESDRFYKQMQEAIGPIKKALADIEAMIKDLQTGTGFFDRTKFDRIMTNLNIAIEKTVPKSVLMEKLGLNDQLDQDRTQWERDKINEAGKQYLVEKRSMNQKWRDAVNAARYQPNDATKLINSAPIVSNAIKSNLTSSVLESQLAVIDAKYESEIEGIDRKFELRKAEIKNEAAFEFSKPSRISSSLHTAATRLEEDFKSDLQLVKDNINILISSIKNAFIEYKESQFFTGVVYDSIENLKGLLKWFINLGGKVGDKASDATVLSFNGAKFFIEDVKDDFESDISEWKASRIDPTKMAVDLTLGNVELKTASSILSATVTESLISMINFDESLGEEAIKFEKFRKRIEEIKDFKGVSGKWGTNDLTSIGDVTIYVSLISKISLQIASAPIRMASPRQKEKLELQKNITETSNEFRKLLNHNSIVSSVLFSYNPYQSGMTNQLKRLLDSLAPWLAYAMTALSAQKMAKALEGRIQGWLDTNLVDCSKYKAAKKELADLEAKLNEERALASTTTNNNTAMARAYQTQNYREAQAERALISTVDDIKTGPSPTPTGFGELAPRLYVDESRNALYT